MKKVLLLVFLFLLCISINACNYSNKRLNLEDYELVFYDEFDGDSLDLTKWAYRGTGKRRGGLIDPGQVRIENGNLVIYGEYHSAEKYGEEAWCGGMITIKDKYLYGYFEISCICNDTDEFWSAFWLQSSNSYIHENSKGGPGGAEIDIFETYQKKNIFNKNKVFSYVHCNGYDWNHEQIDSRKITETTVKNLTSQYNTFGLMWTEKEYIFYVNGIETGRTSFAKGTSQVPEEVIVSLEFPDLITIDKTIVSKYTVDYVKVYQKERRIYDYS